MGLVQSQHDTIIVIIHQAAYHGKGSMILSSTQLEADKIIVDDRSKAVGGQQRIVTLEGYIIPLQCRQGLPYLDMKKPTEQDIDMYPHVVLTSDADWDPSSIDHEHVLNDPNTWNVDLALDPDDVPYIE